MQKSSLLNIVLYEPEIPVNAGNIIRLVEKKTDVEFELGRLSIFIDDKNSVHMKGSVSDIKNIEIKI